VVLPLAVAPLSRQAFEVRGEPWNSAAGGVDEGDSAERESARALGVTPDQHFDDESVRDGQK